MPDHQRARLQELVEIAEERQCDIPALIYEARSTSVRPASFCSGCNADVCHVASGTG